MKKSFQPHFPGVLKTLVAALSLLFCLPLCAASLGEAGRDSGASFAIGGIRYTIAELQDEPAFQMPNRMDGKDGHTVSFTYAETGAEAEAANKLLYSGARLRQPNGDLVRAYSNMDNLGNPYVLYFGLSDGVLLSDCAFTLSGDEGDAEISLAKLSQNAAKASASDKEPAPTAAASAIADVVNPEGKGVASAQSAAATEPSVALSDDAGEEERRIADVLIQCAAEAKDEWQKAIYHSGIQGLKLETDGAQTVYTFLLRGFDPDLKALGKYQGESKDGYLKTAVENAKKYLVEASLILESGAFTEKSVKTLKGVVKKAASTSSKSFKDKRILSAISDALFFNDFTLKGATAQDVVMPSSEYVAWALTHANELGELSAQQRTAFFLCQTKRSLDVSGGPFAMKLSCTGANLSDMLEAARKDALEKLKYLDYETRWANDQVEYQFLLALADNALTLRKKGKDVSVVYLNIDGERLYGDEYETMLAAYPYSETLSVLEADTRQLPEYAAKQMPSVGLLSGANKGTQVRIKAPKNSAAYYIQMRNYHNDEVVVTGFVQPGKTCNLRMPKGDYYAVMASGSTWYGEKYLFGDETRIRKTGLIEIPGSNYVSTLTLEVKKGNIDVYGGDEGDLQK